MVKLNGRLSIHCYEQECAWDGGDCCEDTCVPGNTYECGSGGYYCLDPDALTSLTSDYCEFGAGNWIGNGLCNYDNNNEVGFPHQRI